MSKITLPVVIHKVITRQVQYIMLTKLPPRYSMVAARSPKATTVHQTRLHFHSVVAALGQRPEHTHFESESTSESENG